MCKFKPKQIKMCYLRREPTYYPLPTGFYVTKYSKPEEQIEYVNVCRNGLSHDDDNEAWFKREIIDWHDCKPTEDCFFIRHGEEYVACITAIFHPLTKEGYVHQVSVRSDYRGRGLSYPLNYIALKKLYDQGAKRVVLITGDKRLPALKCYLKSGFIPMVFGLGKKYKEDAERRWKLILKGFGYKECDMLTAFGKKYKLKID